MLIAAIAVRGRHVSAVCTSSHAHCKHALAVQYAPPISNKYEFFCEAYLGEILLGSEGWVQRSAPVLKQRDESLPLMGA